MKHKHLTPAVWLAVAMTIAAAAMSCHPAPAASASVGFRPEPLESFHPELGGPLAAGDALMVTYKDFIAYSREAGGHPAGLMVACYDAASGRLRWEKRLEKDASAEFVEGDLAYLRYKTGIYVLHAATGEKVVEVKVPLDRYGEVTVGPGRLFVTERSYEGPKDDQAFLAAFDTSDFRQVWRRGVGYMVVDLAARGDVVQATVMEDTEMILLDHRATLRAADGRVLSRAPVRRYAWYEEGRAVPADSTQAVRDRMRLALARSRRGEIHTTPRTEVVHAGALVFFGDVGELGEDGVLYAVDDKTGTVAWQRTVPGLADIALDGGIVIAAYQLPAVEHNDTVKRLVAFEAQTGRQLWETTFHDGSTSATEPSVIIGPAAGEGAVIAGYCRRAAARRGGHLGCYDIATGQRRWERDLPDVDFHYFGFLIHAGRLYVPTVGEQIIVLSLANGSALGRLQTGHLGEMPVIAAQGPRLYVCGTPEWTPNSDDTDPRVVAFDTMSLRKLWESKGYVFGGPTEISPKDGVVEVLESDTLYKLDARNGRIMSHKEIPRTDFDLSAALPGPVRVRLDRLRSRSDGERKWDADTTSIFASGGAFLAGVTGQWGEDSYLYAIRGDTGQIAWQQAVAGLWRIGLVGDAVVAWCMRPDLDVGGSTHWLAALDTRSGRPLWEQTAYKPSSDLAAQGTRPPYARKVAAALNPVAAGGLIVAGYGMADEDKSPASYLVGCNPATGSVVWQESVPLVRFTDLAGCGDAVYVSTEQDGVYVLNADGQPLAHLPVGFAGSGTLEPHRAMACTAERVLVAGWVPTDPSWMFWPSGRSAVVAYDPKTLTEQWRHAFLPYWVPEAITLKKGVVDVEGTGGELARLQAADGKIMEWTDAGAEAPRKTGQRALTRAQARVAEELELALMAGRAQLLDAGKMRIVLNNRCQATARLKAFRVVSHAEVWRRKVPGLEQALVLGRKVIVSYRGTEKASAQAGLRAFDLASGRPLWHRKFPVPPPGMHGVASPKQPAPRPGGPRGQSKPRPH